MMNAKEKFISDSFDVFKDLLENHGCTKADINRYYEITKYEMEHYGVCAGKKQWLTKDEASDMMGISTSTFDRIVLNGGLSRGKKVSGKKNLLWKVKDIEDCQKMMVLKGGR